MAQTVSKYTLLDMFYDGGIFMYPLLLCSLFGLGVIFAKAYMLWAARRGSRKILSEVGELIERQRVDDAIRLCEATPGPVAAILLAGMRRSVDRSYSSADIEKAIRTTGTIELGFLERGLPVLATVSNVAPLLGFLGTVAGMIAAFAAIEYAGQVEAALVAGGIKIALITTAAGLMIAVPVNVAYNYFVTRIDKLIAEMEEGSDRVLNMIWDRGRGGRPVATASNGSPAAGSHVTEALGDPERRGGGNREGGGMMALRRRKSRVAGEIPTASMADIAFLLLIFFLVTTVFDEERGLPLVLPESQSAVEVSQENILHLQIQADGTVQVRLGEDPEGRTVTAAQIGSIWRQESSGNPDLIAAVETHPDATYRQMIDVLDQLQAAEANRISLQILEDRP